MQPWYKSTINKNTKSLRGTCAETEDATRYSYLSSMDVAALRGTCAETEDATRYSYLSSMDVAALRGTYAETEDATFLIRNYDCVVLAIQEALALKQRMQHMPQKGEMSVIYSLRGTCAETEDATEIEYLGFKLSYISQRHLR